MNFPAVLASLTVFLLLSALPSQAQTPGCLQSAMNASSFASLVSSLQSESNEITRQEKLEKYLPSVHVGFNSNQTVTLLELFHNEITRQEILESLNPFIMSITCRDLASFLLTFANEISREEIVPTLLNFVTDLPWNNVTILNCFHNSISRDEVLDMINAAKPMSCVFGDVNVVKHVTFIIDVSGSMSTIMPSPYGPESRLSYVQQQLVQVINDNLQADQLFNIVSFSSYATAWKPGVVPVNSANLLAATNFVNAQQAGGSTNLQAALQLVMADSQCQGIFLLSDGQPDTQTGILQAVQSWSSKGNIVNTILFASGGSVDPVAYAFMQKMAALGNGVFRTITS